MNETLVGDYHLVAELTADEYIRLRTLITQAHTVYKKTTLKQWVGQAIREKLDGHMGQDIKEGKQ